MNKLPGMLARIYRLILRAYPSAYFKTFGDEMQNTFIDGFEEANTQGKLVPFLLREMTDTPKALVNIYWYGWRQKIAGGVELLRQATSTPDLPPAPPDGRESWQQYFLEISIFLIAGSFMILATYFPLDGLRPDWGRNAALLGNMILPLTIPFLLVGLARGLPRWAYPLGGLLLSYSGLIADQASLWLFLTFMLLAVSILIAGVILTDPHPSRFPIPIRRIGQSLSTDWTRLSFGIFGAMPLVLLMAFDDAYTNNRTPYFAFSVLAMFVSALVYCKSRNSDIQITALLAGLTFSVCGALLDRVSFHNGLKNWTMVHASGVESLLWMVGLWAQWTALIASPFALMLFGKVVRLKPAV